MDSITAPKRPNTRLKKYVYVLDRNGRILNYRWFRYADEFLISAYVEWVMQACPTWEKIYSIYPTPTVTSCFWIAHSSRAFSDWIPFKRCLEENATVLAQRRFDAETLSRE